MPQSGDEKIVLTLDGVEKGFSLNSTNAHACADEWGDDYTTWPGHTVTVRAVPTTFGGKSVKGLRVFFE